MRSKADNPSPQWRELIIRGDYSAALKKLANNASGAYAVREKKSHRVVYVGESSRGNLWRTLLRHFQAPESFRAVRERGVFTGDPKKYEVAVEVTSRGPRPRSPAEASKPSKRLRDLRSKKKRHTTEADQRALDLQAAWIESLKPLRNVDDGKADDGPRESTCPECHGSGDDLLGDPCPLCRGSGRVVLDNPASGGTVVGHLTELGVLTRMQVGRRVLAWSLRDGPVLAYDAKKRLFIVYDRRRVRASSLAELREYARTHWGAKGRGDCSNGAVPTAPFVKIGRGTSITYTTKKGRDVDLVDWVHKWGEGGWGKKTPPDVVEHRCASKNCPWNGAVMLAGGSYTVSSRGIVG